MYPHELIYTELPLRLMCGAPLPPRCAPLSFPLRYLEREERRGCLVAHLHVVIERELGERVRR